MENGLDDMCALLTESKLQTSDGLANFLAQIANVDLRADQHVQVGGGMQGPVSQSVACSGLSVSQWHPVACQSVSQSVSSMGLSVSHESVNRLSSEFVYQSVHKSVHQSVSSQ